MFFNFHCVCLSKKRFILLGDFLALEYEHTNHIATSYKSYFATVRKVLYYADGCCFYPLLGGKGVS